MDTLGEQKIVFILQDVINNSDWNYFAKRDKLISGFLLGKNKWREGNLMNQNMWTEFKDIWVALLTGVDFIKTLFFS